jgi:hypothetical protein
VGEHDNEEDGDRRRRQRQWQMVEMFKNYRPVVPVEFHSDELYAEPSPEVWSKVKVEKTDRSEFRANLKKNMRGRSELKARHSTAMRATTAKRVRRRRVVCFSSRGFFPHHYSLVFISTFLAHFMLISTFYAYQRVLC